MTETKLTQKEKVTKKYGAMVSYYAELLAECHNAVRKNSVLSKLDPMGQKTSATTLFIRTCSRMDKTDETKQKAEKLMDVSGELSSQKIA